MQNYTEGELLKDDREQPLKLFGIHYTELVYVEPSTFVIGDNNSENEDEKPQTSITFSNGYFIGKYAVTQALYEAVMGENPSEFKSKYRPVERVSHDNICKNGGFLERLNTKIRTDYPILEGSFSLPSEAQWEYAARGGKYWNTPKFAYSGSQNLNDVAWYNKNSNNQTMPVGLKQPNALDLYDMSGNVWEWCTDWYIDNYHQIPKNGSSNITEGINRVLRGGSYFFNSNFCRVATRINYSTGNHTDDLGFRLVFSQFNR